MYKDNYYEIDYYDTILKEVLKIEFSNYSIKIDSNYKIPHFTNIILKYGEKSPLGLSKIIVNDLTIIYSKRQLPIFLNAK